MSGSPRHNEMAAAEGNPMSPKSRNRRILSAASTALVTAAVLAGCSTSHSPSIAHAEGAATQATTSTTSNAGSASTQAKFQAYLASERSYAACMRGIGLDVTDPDADGVQRANFKNQITRGGHLSAAQNEGLRTCQAKLLPDPRPQTYPTESAEEFSFDKKMATCMRRHGVPGYPDPIRETDPSLPNVKHYQAVMHALPTGTKTYQNALNTCSVIVTGHKGVG
jgi:hypothetical protein